MCNFDLDLSALKKELYEKVDTELEEFKIRMEGVKLGISLALEAVSDYLSKTSSSSSKKRKAKTEFSISDYIAVDDDWNPPASP